MDKTQNPSTGVLLTMGDYWGTLAAARDFGQAGYRVILADARPWVPTAHSRFLHERVPCPPPQNWDQFIPWLIAFGKERPGLFLYPTSDDTAWVYTQYAAQLRPSFILHQPDVSVIYKLLNKPSLQTLCRKLGIETPQTWYPISLDQVERLRGEKQRPLLLKPRTQIGLKIGHKGRLLTPGEDLLVAYQGFQQQLSYREELLRHDPRLSWPMIQEYHPVARQQIVSVAGYADRMGRLTVRSSRKVLQRPRRLGVGLCFEAVPVDAQLVGQIQAICREAGYFGVFEAEFIADGAQRLLIDFNPRFYGQLGFEVARGLRSPCLAAAEALGQDSALWALAHAGDGPQRPVYSTRWLLRLSLLTGWVAGKHTWQDLWQWRQWCRSSKHRYIDALYRAEDPWPYYVDMIVSLLRYGRHPRDTIRKFFFDT